MSTAETKSRIVFGKLLEDAYRISLDAGKQVEEALNLGSTEPLSHQEAYSLMTRIISILKKNAARRGDEAAEVKLDIDVDAFAQALVGIRTRPIDSAPAGGRDVKHVELIEHDGIKPAIVRPRPTFHEKEVSMRAGYVRTRDIELWNENSRIEIHLEQFQKLHGRKPQSEELLDIMLNKLKLEGTGKEDQFKIPELARSIANNGVRRPPIIDIDGTLLDGNRRVAACNLILFGDEFDTAQRKRVEHVFVWQLTEDATPEEKEAVVVSLNFEPDFKEDWPEYVKAHKVYEEWQSRVALEPRSPARQRVLEMKRELSRKFALGSDVSIVTRYLKMVECIKDFEEYEIAVKQRDPFEVKHRANKYFQYFDELTKGTNPGGVYFYLNQDETFKHTVYDLLFDEKFANWTQIRDLKHIYLNKEAMEALADARIQADPELASDFVDLASAIAKGNKAENRLAGANTRIETFVKWLEDLPVKAFRDQISTNNLAKLLRALKLVEVQATKVLTDDDMASANS